VLVPVELEIAVDDALYHVIWAYIFLEVAADKTYELRVYTSPTVTEIPLVNAQVFDVLVAVKDKHELPYRYLAVVLSKVTLLPVHPVVLFTKEELEIRFVFIILDRALTHREHELTRYFSS
jgi:hypothetical protein